jgi:hypothetical protein
MDRLETIILILAGLMVGAAHWNFYVKPADAHRTCVMTCMDGDMSRPAYDKCLTQIAERKFVCE